MNRVNLLPPARRVAGRQRRAVGRWVKVNAAYAVLAVAAAVAYVGSRPTPTVAAERGPTQADLTRLTDKLASVRKQAAAVAAQARTAAEVTERPDWGYLLAALAGALGDDAFLTGIETAQAVEGSPTVLAKNAEPASPDPTPARFVLTGVGRSQEAVARLVLKVEGLRVFARVQLVQTTPQPVRSVDGVAFRVLCTLGRGGRAS